MQIKINFTNELGLTIIEIHGQIEAAQREEVILSMIIGYTGGKTKKSERLVTPSKHDSVKTFALFPNLSIKYPNSGINKHVIV